MNKKTFLIAASAAVIIILCFLTQLAAFDVFDTNAPYLYLLIAALLAAQAALSYLLFRLGAGKAFAAGGVILYSLAAAWSTLMLVGILGQFVFTGRGSFGLACLSAAGNAALLIFYLLRRKSLA